jgi:GAF domain-containing protein
VDWPGLFQALPTAYLVMTPDLRIADANQAYLDSVGRRREEILGRDVFEAFPPTPDAMDESGVSRIQVSFERVLRTGQAETMPLQKYDVPDSAGGMTERYWSLIHVPVLDEQGRPALLVQRAENVTDYVHERELGRSLQERGEQLGRRVEEVEADLYARGLELRAALEAQQLTARRLAGLADVAMQITGAQTVDDLVGIVVDRGMVALGADGGAVAVRVEGRLQLAVTASLGEVAQRDFAELPLDGPLPGSVSARTGERVLLPDASAALAWHPTMQSVLDATSCPAWVCLPLAVEGRLLGSLSVGWRESRTFDTDELDVLDALAAQCAQALDRIQVRQAERRSTTRVRRLSETLQRSLLTEPPQADDLQIAVRYRPAAQEAQVGGDWYDAFLTPDGATCLVIGDVAGHDRDAAAAMGQLRNLLRGVTHALRQPPAAVLTGLDVAVRDLSVGSLATAVLARVERGAPPLRTLRWSNAGHLPPLLIGPDGSTALLRSEPDLLLGLDPETPRSDHALDVAPGSTLLLYTDGLVERRGASIDEGLEAWWRSRRSWPGSSWRSCATRCSTAWAPAATTTSPCWRCGCTPSREQGPLARLRDPGGVQAGVDAVGSRSSSRCGPRCTTTPASTTSTSSAASAVDSRCAIASVVRPRGERVERALQPHLGGRGRRPRSPRRARAGRGRPGRHGRPRRAAAPPPTAPRRARRPGCADRAGSCASQSPSPSSVSASSTSSSLASGRP